MSMEQNVVHRKAFNPWYDTDTMCAATMIFTILVFLFGFAGLSVCEETSRFQAYVWVPSLLLTLNGILFVSLFIRLAKRYIIRHQNRYLKDFSGNGL